MSDDGGYKEWQMQQTIDALTAVAEQLIEHHKLAVEQWTSEAQRVKELEDNVHELRAENEVLRPDAERYQYIRHYRVTVCDVDGEGDRTYMIDDEEFEELDEAVDALRGEGER